MDAFQLASHNSVHGFLLRMYQLLVYYNIQLKRYWLQKKVLTTEELTHIEPFNFAWFLNYVFETLLLFWTTYLLQPLISVSSRALIFYLCPTCILDYHEMEWTFFYHLRCMSTRNIFTNCKVCMMAHHQVVYFLHIMS